MDSLCFTLFILSIGCTRLYGQIVLNVSDKGRSKHTRKREDYTFEDKLKRAAEECSYIARKDDESDRKEAIQRIKNEMNNRNVKEFYKEREEEKKRGKQYYEEIERQVRNKVLLEGNSDFPIGARRRHRSEKRHRGHHVPRPPSRWRNLPSVPASFGDTYLAQEHELFHSLPTTSVFGEHFAEPHGGRIHSVFKRSRRTKAQDPSFQEGKFKDHNNCFSRCVFARMELVDALGFPQESILRKAFEDLIDNKKIRRAKIKKTFSCFDELQKVAIDDNCIYSNKIFKCLRLGEAQT